MNSRPSRDLAGAGLIVLAAACFGTLGPLSRFAGDAGVDSLILVTWRAAIGAGCMVGFLIARRSLGLRSGVALRSLPPRELWFMGAAAVANTVLNLSVFIAFERVSIALALLVFYLYPSLVALVSVTWFGERLDRIRWTALAVSLVGTVLVVAGAGGLGELDLPGVALAFVGALGQTFYVLAARHGFSRVPGSQAAALTMGGAFVVYLAVMVGIGGLAGMAQPLASGAALWPVAVAGVVGAGVPTLAYILGIRRLGAPRAAILATLEPVVGVTLAALLLHEQPTLVQALGGVMIIGAGVLLQLRPRAEAAEHEAVADPPEAMA